MLNARDDQQAGQRTIPLLLDYFWTLILPQEVTQCEVVRHTEGALRQPGGVRKELLGGGLLCRAGLVRHGAIQGLHRGYQKI